MQIPVTAHRSMTLKRTLKSDVLEHLDVHRHTLVQDRLQLRRLSAVVRVCGHCISSVHITHTHSRMHTHTHKENGQSDEPVEGFAEGVASNDFTREAAGIRHLIPQFQSILRYLISNDPMKRTVAVENFAPIEQRVRILGTDVDDLGREHQHIGSLRTHENPFLKSKVMRTCRYFSPERMSSSIDLCISPSASITRAWRYSVLPQLKRTSGSRGFSSRQICSRLSHNTT